MTRRELIRNAGVLWAVSAVSGCAGLASGIRGVRTRAKIGVLANLEIEWPKSTVMLKKALGAFRDAGVDAVVLLGNLTRSGAPNQYEVLADAWRAAFKGSQPPPCVLVLGEQDLERWQPGYADYLKPIGTVVEQGGHVIDVRGFRFGASIRKRTGRWNDPVALAFYAQPKLVLTDALCFSDPTSRAVCAGSMSDVAMGEIYAGVAKSLKVAQGLLVTVLGDEIEVARLDFTQPTQAWERVAGDWTVPADPTAEVVVPVSVAPQFRPNAEATVVAGFRPLKKPLMEEIYTVRWPVVRGGEDGARAFAYELRVVSAEKHPLAEPILVLSPAFHLAPRHESPSMSYAVPIASLPKGKVRFAITPVSSDGKRGSAIYTEAVVGIRD